jgi:SAM-dependent methyltransferase
MKLKQLQRTWDELGRWDPLWAILTTEDKINRGWKPDEFFKTGRDEIADVIHQVDQLIPGFPRRNALDFGCGVGRLTQAMCRYFEKCHGVDIAASMIKLARQYNQYGHRCQYQVNANVDLRIFPDNTFDFIYSNIVLQHMTQEFSKRYIKEFLRTLKPAGVIVFQLPSRAGFGPPTTAEAPSAGNESLPPDGFAAHITGPDCLSCRPRSAINVRAKIKNVSSVTWPCSRFKSASFPIIQLGNHWLDRKGRMKALDDGRTRLPHDLKPGAEIELSLFVVAPRASGTYQLELDMVQEGVAWFGNRGSKTCKIPVQSSWGMTRLVNPFSALRSITDHLRMKSPGRMPRMEMHGTAKDDVVRLVATHGGRVLRVDERDSLGPDWISNTYFVTK